MARKIKLPALLHIREIESELRSKPIEDIYPDLELIEEELEIASLPPFQRAKETHEECFLSVEALKPENYLN